MIKLKLLIILLSFILLTSSFLPGAFGKFSVDQLTGDVNDDGKIDGKDIALVTKVFNSSPEKPSWNPKCDLNSDQRIDGIDLVIVIKALDRKSFGTYIDDTLYNNVSVWDKFPFLFDSEGVPMVNYTDYGIVVYNPVSVSEYAIALYHDFLATNNITSLRRFFVQANWLVRNAKNMGNFSVWEYKFDYHTWDYNLTNPWISAMAQSLGASVLIRAYSMTGDDTYLHVADMAISAFDVEKSDGGVKLVDYDGVWYEEYICKYCVTSKVLNGFLFGLYGLYEYAAYTSSPKALDLFWIGVETLRLNIDRYDAVEYKWSYYDLYHEDHSYVYPHLSPLVYHKIVINQLKILYQISGIEILRYYSDKFASYL